MDGSFLIYDGAGRVRTIPLPKELSGLGSDVADAVRIDGPDVQSGHALSRWIGARASWELRAEREQAPVWVNGKLVPTGGGVLLVNGDEVILGGLPLRFCRVPAEPLLGGAVCQEVTLGAEPLVLGRAVPGAEDAGRRLNLDTDDSSMSKVHAVIEWSNGRHWLEDRSRAGTELNGQGAFGRRELVVGDRIRLRDYNFEYDGRTLRRVPAKSGATLEAAGVGFEVSGPQGPRDILRDINVSIKSGEFVGILGGSGQGKTTLLRVLCGLIRPTSGVVKVNGAPLDPGALAVGYVPQDDLVHGELTVEEAITAAAKLRLKTSPENLATVVSGVVDRLGLSEHAGKRIGTQISGGQRKRASIATELLTRPSVLLLDEPSSGLDPYSEEELMTFLQSMRHTGQTVICTTHVLNKAYLFDRILFVHGGRLIFAGTPQEARQHFLGEEKTGTQTAQRAPLERIYREVQQSRRGAAEWEARYRESSFGPGREALAPPLPSVGKPPPPRARPGVWDVVRTLLLRQRQLLTGDRVNVWFLIGQAAGIGLLTGCAAANPGLRLFLMVIATLWFGCSNAAQQIVTESAIRMRERVCGVGRHSYILSKFCFFSGVTVAQSVLLFLCAAVCGRIFHGAVPEDAGMPLAAWGMRLGALGLAAVCGTGLGLAVSSLARSVTQAVLLVPLLMIPQVLLGGYVITRPEMGFGTRAFSSLWPAWWSQRIMDVSNAYGRPVPLMSDNTRQPVFLMMRPEIAAGADTGVSRASPEPEKVKADPAAWSGARPPADEFSFQRVSDYNASWRNLLVPPAHVGQHKPGSNAVTFARNDVTLQPRQWEIGTPRQVWKDAASAWISAAVLFGHIVLFYLLVVFGLRRADQRR